MRGDSEVLFSGADGTKWVVVRTGLRTEYLLEITEHGKTFTWTASRDGQWVPFCRLTRAVKENGFAYILPEGACNAITLHRLRVLPIENGEADRD